MAVRKAEIVSLTPKLRKFASGVAWLQGGPLLRYASTPGLWHATIFNKESDVPLRYEIHPSIGIMRMGNSPDFYLAPDVAATLPIECDEHGNEGRSRRLVKKFKDAQGRVRRQAARFRIFVHDETGGVRELTRDSPEVASIEWTVHLANKKACWYQFYIQLGNRMFPHNTYREKQVPLRNADTKGIARRKLIIDPGPRTIAGRNRHVRVAKDNVPRDYKHANFPTGGEPFAIDQLGQLMTDEQGRLLVVGGFGHTCGTTKITLFIGADGWFDDSADGPVTCKFRLKNGEVHTLDAWVLSAAPKVAPELLNIVTLDDILYDVGVQYFDLEPGLYTRKKGWNRQFVASFETDIAPLLHRMRDYCWVANVPAMTAFATPDFDCSDPSAANRENRERWYKRFRKPPGPSGEENLLMGADGLPLFPLNSGSNSEMNGLLRKFLNVTETQYALLRQWADGKFVRHPRTLSAAVHPLDRATTGTCVGAPMSPGVEVTWSTRNPKLYRAPYRVKHRSPDGKLYRKQGLSPETYDETTGSGCEPGDLTKRMAVPWQADWYQCSIQHVQFSREDNVDEDLLPSPPTFLVYWWPPQSPMQVISGVRDEEEQWAAGIDGGSPVSFQRGINSFAEMVVAWHHLGFVTNLAPNGHALRYFAEVERNHGEFVAGSVAVGSVSNASNATDTTFLPVWFLKEHNARKTPRRLRARHIRGL